MNRLFATIPALVVVCLCHATDVPQEGARGMRVAPEELIRQFDRNGDGRIGRDEAPARMQQRWEQIDTDRDSIVTLEELKARDARVGGAGGGAGGGGGGGGAGPEPARAAGPSVTRQSEGPFSVMTIGTGSPQYDAKRSGPSTLIQFQGRYLLVDMGNGTQARLNEAGLAVRELSAILLTHHHIDHDEEFIPVLIQTMLRGGEVDVVGPPGTARLAEFARTFYAEDLAYRMSRRGKTADDLARAAVREVEGGESFELAGLKITTAKVNHTIHTVAYRFDAGGQSIVVSGDLSYSDSLVTLARQADVLVIDSGAAPVREGQAERQGGGQGRPGGGGDQARAHASREDIARMAQEAGVKKLVLTHIAPGTVDEEATKKALGEIFKGEVIVAHDLLEVLPAGAAAGAPTLSGAGGGGRAYVNAAGTGGTQDGRSWETAFPTIQAALASGAGEIWVAQGIYRTTTGTDRNATFQLRPRVALYGGFAGTETNLSQRSGAGHESVLSGEIGREGDAEDNALHVVTGADDAVLDGFTVTGGCALNGGPPGGMGGPPRGPRGAPGSGPIHTTPDAILSGSNPGSGAGMLNFRCAPVVRNCLFTGNRAGKGGGAYNMTSTTFPPRPEQQGRAPTFINCIFRNNTAEARGAGVSNDLGTSPTFLNCVFEGNRTPQKGGGMYNDFGCAPTLINCLFTGNEAESAAGMGNDGASSPLLDYCSFLRNHATDTGPSLYQGTGPASCPAVIRCVIASNTCDWGGTGIYNWHDNAPVLKDSIVDAPVTGDIGYKPGRFVESQLAELRDALAPFRAQPVREAAAPAAARIPFSPRIVCVNASAAPGGDGRTWATARTDLREALADAGKDGAEVWVASGVYPAGPSRSDSFVLQPGVRLFGGFTGRELQRIQRNTVKNATVLDGRHAYHVLIGANGAVLDGFTITGGFADGEGYDGKGGGLVNYRRGPQGRPNAEVAAGFSMEIVRCTFTNNYARDGGAVYSYDRAKVAFRDCVFAQNRADNGGAVLDRVGAASTFVNSLFSGNTARWRGGALYLDYGARAVITGCRFSDNATDGHGGALFTLSRASQLENTTATLSDCSFAGNRAAGRGGAIANTDSTLLTATDCAFERNQAGLRGGAVSSFQRGVSTLTNCRYAANAAGTGPSDVDAEPAAPDRSRP